MMQFYPYSPETVPKSYVTTKQVTQKDGKTYSVPVTVYVPVLTISKCNQLILTKWLPDEERFEFYTKEVPPVRFCPVDKPSDLPPLRGYGDNL